MDMTTSEKAAYLKGLLDATNFEDKDTKKILGAFLKVFNSLVEDVEANAENIDNIDSRLSEVDEDLGAVESIVYGDFEDEISFADDDFDEEPFDFSEDEIDDDLEEDELDDDFDEDDFDFEGDEIDDEEFEDEAEVAPAPEAQTEVKAETQPEVYEDPEEEEDGEELYEIECPACHETIYLQESVILGGAVDCPACGEPLEFDIEFEEE